MPATPQTRNSAFPDNRPTAAYDAAAALLIVSEDPALRWRLRQAVERDGYRLSEVTSGLACIDSCARQLPDLILLDAATSDLSGVQVCRRLAHHEVPIFLIVDDEPTVNAAFQHGTYDVILRPIHWAVLRQRLARALCARPAQRQMAHLAYHDALTGLPNRQLFMDRCGASLARARRGGGPPALMFLDLNRFQQINDRFGHAIGDQVLRHCAEQLTGAIREGDTVARLGGDEFVVLLEDLSPANAAAVADKILNRFRRPLSIDDLRLTVSTSIGIALYPADGQDIDTLLGNADAAMYHAKKNGGGRYQFFAQGMRTATLRRMLLGNSLHQALHNNEMQLYCQPRYRLEGATLERRLIGFEVLLRWRHPELGQIAPDEFIPLAEEKGLILPIGEWILRQACQHAARWQAAGKRVPITVNLSALQLRQRDLLTVVDITLRDTGLEPGLLELELGEDVLLENSPALAELLWGLHKLGVRLSLDDFGSGPCSLTRLRRLPIQTLTIDRNLTAALPDDGDAAAVTRAAIATAGCLGRRLIAKGVENQAQVDFFLAQNCRDLQGYYCAAPAPLAALTPSAVH